LVSLETGFVCGGIKSNPFMFNLPIWSRLWPFHLFSKLLEWRRVRFKIWKSQEIKKKLVVIGATKLQVNIQNMQTLNENEWSSRWFTLIHSKSLLNFCFQNLKLILYRNFCLSKYWLYSRIFDKLNLIVLWRLSSFWEAGNFMMQDCDSSRVQEIETLDLGFWFAPMAKYWLKMSAFHEH
jgi:hypothetical protein